MSLKINGAAYTHVGKVRTNNEDNYNLFGHYKESTDINEQKYSMVSDASNALASVCDGMGGASSGELASLIAVSNMHPCSIGSVESHSNAEINHINNLICEEIDKRNGTRIGSTLVSLYIDDNKAVCCNVGDSRCYFMRNGQLMLLSKDHSEGQRMIDYGMMSEEEAKNSKSWHVLTQHLGIFTDEFILEPFYSEVVNLMPGDKFLLCSDGVTDLMSDHDIGNILVQSKAPEAIAEDMVNMALEKGGKDNTTVIVLTVSGDMPVAAPVNTASYASSANANASNEKGGKVNTLVGPIGIAFLVLAIVFLVFALIMNGKAKSNADKVKKLEKKLEAYEKNDMPEVENSDDNIDVEDSDIYVEDSDILVEDSDVYVEDSDIVVPDIDGEVVESDPYVDESDEGSISTIDPDTIVPIDPSIIPDDPNVDPDKDPEKLPDGFKIPGSDDIEKMKDLPIKR